MQGGKNIKQKAKRSSGLSGEDKACSGDRQRWWPERDLLSGNIDSSRAVVVEGQDHERQIGRKRRKGHYRRFGAVPRSVDDGNRRAMDELVQRSMVKEVCSSWNEAIAAGWQMFYSIAIGIAEAR
jgi:hypothetical protein